MDVAVNGSGTGGAAARKKRAPFVPKDPPVVLCGTIYDLRMALGMSRYAFVKKLGVAYMTEYRWESHQCPPKAENLRMLRKVASEAGLPFDAKSVLRETYTGTGNVYKPRSRKGR